MFLILDWSDLNTSAKNTLRLAAISLGNSGDPSTIQRTKPLRPR